MFMPAALVKEAAFSFCEEDIFLWPQDRSSRPVSSMRLRRPLFVFTRPIPTAAVTPLTVARHDDNSPMIVLGLQEQATQQIPYQRRQPSRPIPIPGRGKGPVNRYGQLEGCS